MERIDVANLRKAHNMTQSRLADLLQINQSFLSAIERGKSALPTDKENRLMEIFGVDSLDGWLIDDASESVRPQHMPQRQQYTAPPQTEMSESDLINEFLNRFHSQAHSKEQDSHHHDHHERIQFLEKQNTELLGHIESLLNRNKMLDEHAQKLSAQLEDLRAEYFNLMKKYQS